MKTHLPCTMIPVVTTVTTDHRARHGTIANAYVVTVSVHIEGEMTKGKELGPFPPKPLIVGSSNHLCGYLQSSDKRTVKRHVHQ